MDHMAKAALGSFEAAFFTIKDAFPNHRQAKDNIRDPFVSYE